MGGDFSHRASLWAEFKRGRASFRLRVSNKPLGVVRNVKDIEAEALDLYIRDLFSILQFETAIASIDSFDKFCDQYNIPEQNRLQGMKTALRCIQEQHLDELESAYVLGLEGSDEFYRSRLIGRRKRPVSGQVDALSRNAFEALVTLQEGKNTPEVRSAYEAHLSEYIESLRGFFKCNVVLSSEESKASELDLLETSSLHFFIDSLLNPARSHVLDSYLNPFAKHRGRDKHIKGIWREYACAVAFIYREIYESIYGTEFIDMILQADDENKLWEVGRKLEGLCEKRISDQLGARDIRFKLRDKTDFTPLEKLITEAPKPHTRNFYEDLDALFKYLEVKRNDCRSKLFAGPASLVRLIAGEVEFRQRNGIKDPAQILRLIHETKLGNRFSYAVLVDSGWMVFVWCGNDYSRGSIATWQLVESEIARHGNLIQTQDKPLSIEELEEYIAAKSIQHWGGMQRLTEDEYLRSLVNKAIDLSVKVSGLLFELVVAVLLNKNGYLVDWAVRSPALDKLEVDVTARNKEECYVVECSHRLSSGSMKEAEELVDEFKKKVDGLSKMDGYKDLKFHMVYMTRVHHLRNPAMKDVLEFLISEGIIIASLDSLIKSSKINRKEEDRIRKAVERLDCWRPGEDGFTSESRILDISRCYDMIGLPFLECFGFEDSDTDMDDYVEPEE